MTVQVGSSDLLSLKDQGVKTPSILLETCLSKDKLQHHFTEDKCHSK